jgi:proteasome accessory factor B
VKDYRDFDDCLDVILQCLVHQHVMHVEYRSPWRADDERTVHDFAPYTLVMYRGGLYVIGRSEQLDRVVYLAVERIESATKLPERFDYPKEYSPAKHTEGMFGIVDGPEMHVELLLRRPEGAALLSSRRLHPTQRFEPREDGTTLLTMTVRGTSELVNWILGLGPHVEVLAPDGLRAEVARAHEDATALYRR